MWSERNPRWLLFAGEVMISASEINQEHRRMSVEVKGLAEIVRQAKAAISTASDAAAKMQDSAQRVTARIAQVNDMTRQLDAAEAELGAAVGAMSNGGPPLEDTTSSAPTSGVAVGSTSPEEGVRQSLAMVQGR